MTSGFVLCGEEADGGYTLLTGNPNAFNEIIKAEKLNTTEESQARTLSDEYVELTQDRSQPLFALNSFGDIPYLSDLSAEQLQKSIASRIGMARSFSLLPLQMTADLSKSNATFWMAKNCNVGQ